LSKKKSAWDAASAKSIALWNIQSPKIFLRPSRRKTLAPFLESSWRRKERFPLDFNVVIVKNPIVWKPA
jgi:hypothetical protein